MCATRLMTKGENTSQKRKKMREKYFRQLLFSALLLLATLGISTSVARAGETTASATSGEGTCAVTLKIEPADAGTVEVSSGFGSTKKIYTTDELQSIPQGTYIDVTPKPAVGYALSGISVGGVKKEGKSYSTRLTASIEITVTF